MTLTVSDETTDCVLRLRCVHHPPTQSFPAAFSDPLLCALLTLAALLFKVPFLDAPTDDVGDSPASSSADTSSPKSVMMTEVDRVGDPTVDIRSDPAGVCKGLRVSVMACCRISDTDCPKASEMTSSATQNTPAYRVAH